MNSRQRRKLAALQYNDEIRYVEWLKNNSIFYKQRKPVTHHPEVKSFNGLHTKGLTATQALLMISMTM